MYYARLLLCTKINCFFFKQNLKPAGRSVLRSIPLGFSRLINPFENRAEERRVFFANHDQHFKDERSLSVCLTLLVYIKSLKITARLVDVLALMCHVAFNPPDEHNVI